MSASNDATASNVKEPNEREREKENNEVKSEEEKGKNNEIEDEEEKGKNNEIKDEEDKGKKNEIKDEEDNWSEYGSFVVIPPNGGWGWMVVLSAFYCNVVVDGIQLTFGVFLKAISQDLGVEYPNVALAGSLMFGIHLLMGPVCSGCNSVFGLRPVTIAGCLICCLGVGISSFAEGFWFLYFSFGVLGGIGLGFVYMNTLVITSLYFTTLMPVAIAIVVSGTGIGTMIFAGLGSFLLSVTTWQNSFLMEAALAGSMSFAAITFKPLKPVRVKVSGMNRASLQETESIGESSRRRSVFIKTEMPTTGSVGSLLTYRNLAFSVQDAAPEIEFKKKKNRCNWSRCCKRTKPEPENEDILVLMEIPNEDPNSQRKSYIIETEEEQEIPLLGGEHSAISHKTTSHKTIYTKVDYTKKKKKCGFWKTLRKSITVMLDYRLLKSWSFFIFTVSGAVNLAAYLIVFVYEKDRCEDLGFSETTAVAFVITLGGVNVFWRLLLGAIAIIPKVRYWALAISGMVIGGVATMVSGYNDSIYFQFAFCFLFGLGMASFAVFRMPLLIDLVGVEFLENAAGINLLFMGVFCIIFPPLFGWIKKVTDSYNLIFMVTGSLTVISALVLIKLKKVDLEKIKKETCRCMKRRK